VLGVQRAFQVSGARAAMVTLWPVDDAATQRLVLEFYRNWWDRGMDKVTALQAAQLAMLRGRLNCPDHALVAAAGGPALADPRARGVRRPDVPSDYRHPYYWAGFVLSGDWR